MRAMAGGKWPCWFSPIVLAVVFWNVGEFVMASNPAGASIMWAANTDRFRNGIPGNITLRHGATLELNCSDSERVTFYLVSEQQMNDCEHDMSSTQLGTCGGGRSTTVRKMMKPEAAGIHDLAWPIGTYFILCRSHRGFDEMYLCENYDLKLIVNVKGKESIPQTTEFPKAPMRSSQRYPGTPSMDDNHRSSPPALSRGDGYPQQQDEDGILTTFTQQPIASTHHRAQPMYGSDGVPVGPYFGSSPPMSASELQQLGHLLHRYQQNLPAAQASTTDRFYPVGDHRVMTGDRLVHAPRAYVHVVEAGNRKGRWNAVDARNEFEAQASTRNSGYGNSVCNALVVLVLVVTLWAI